MVAMLAPVGLRPAVAAGIRLIVGDNPIPPELVDVARWGTAGDLGAGARPQWHALHPTLSPLPGATEKGEHRRDARRNSDASTDDSYLRRPYGKLASC